MEFLLFLTFDGVRFGDYGPLVEGPDVEAKVERYPLENGWDDVDLFDADISSINENGATMI